VIVYVNGSVDAGGALIRAGWQDLRRALATIRNHERFARVGAEEVGGADGAGTRRSRLGAPEITPEVGFNVSPEGAAGRRRKQSGGLPAVSVNENGAELCWPLACSVVLVIVGGV
jgi:hypothetical protein